MNFDLREGLFALLFALLNWRNAISRCRTNLVSYCAFLRIDVGIDNNYRSMIFILIRKSIKYVFVSTNKLVLLNKILSQ